MRACGFCGMPLRDEDEHAEICLSFATHKDFEYKAIIFVVFFGVCAIVWLGKVLYGYNI